MRLSVVVPAFNEEESIAEFHHRLTAALTAINDVSYDIIYVDDGSKDRTRAIVTELCKHDPLVSLLSLSRNFGKEAATTAGIAAAKGDAVMSLDSDGQHPPQLISQFVEAWRQGAQVVVGVRSSNSGEGMVKRMGSRWFYRILRSLGGVDVVPGGTDFQLLDREAVTAFLEFPERGRMTRRIVQSLGFERAEVQFAAEQRIAGTAAYSVSRLISLAIDTFVTSSMRPLHLSITLGTGLAVLALLAGLFVLVEQVILGDPLRLNFTGSAMLGILITFLTGLILSTQGIMAFYLAGIHREALGRPLYIINERESTRGDRLR